ncbi:VOC family protein [Solihabitans fulvus]|uniref:VOC family protein n=1 Tax=Solihabitans fulvus TaxID=1892852 RepID=A0A5B2WLU5_9PSEU|nr:VOC family protein [Solihabitans fulvus]KAA2252973.1 VOC family protein [Solihabitans fulvus]
MPEITSYSQGTPTWIDLSTPDIEASKKFYGALFGWDFEVGPPETGGYTNAQLQGKNVAGLMQQMPDMSPPEAGPPVTAWSTYLASDDVDATAAAIEANGGRLMMPAMDVMDLGRMLVAFDPLGTMIGAWQAGRHKGAELANEPGTFVWNELATTDVAVARPFYAAAFGVEISGPMSEDFDYTTFRSAGRDVGGIYPADEGTAAQWKVYFGVADTDAAAKTATDNGGTVVSEPTDTPYGRMATIRDPQGAMFSIMSTPAQG